MSLQRAGIVSMLVAIAASQTTYTGCHMDGSVSICFGPDGEESAMTTLATAVSTFTIPASAAAITTSEPQTTAFTDCHLHETAIFCIDGHGDEVSVSVTGTPTTPIPAQYTGCHSHNTKSYCVDEEGNDVLVLPTTGEGHDHAEEEGRTDEAAEGELDCHFHAGVEHCVAAGESESQSESSSAATSSVCDAPPSRDYNIGLRIGSIFIILATSSIAVFFPLILHKLPLGRINSTLFTAIKQFGTGIIISTAFVHLYTHAYLMFTNNCLTGIDYEATTSAVVMAGLFVAFLVEYIGYRFVVSRQSRTSPATSEQALETSSDPKLTHQTTTGTSALQDISHSHSPANFNPYTPLAVHVMEAGILFHSVLIGLTLVVAPDNSANTSGYYNTLLAVIVFHQFFEGLALGARIALLSNASVRFGIWSKVVMAGAFALITPLGMAIGVGVLNEFNGNDQSTILTIAVLDALSAGVLLWVGVVDMWGRDWAVAGGEMVEAGFAKVALGLGSLMVGMVLMSVLGKWA